jgi:hypothetical protein
LRIRLPRWQRNRLWDEVLRELEERGRAISEERQARHAELRAEAKQREAAVGALRRDFNDLRRDYGRDTDGIADHWPGWLAWRVLVLVAVFYAAARLSGAVSIRWTPTHGPTSGGSDEAPNRLCTRW